MMVMAEAKKNKMSFILGSGQNLNMSWLMASATTLSAPPAWSAPNTAKMDRPSTKIII